MTLTEWLLGDDTGDSSKTICAVMTGSTIERSDVPYDPGDFGRCYRLLKVVPAWLPRMPEVAQKYPMWGPMVGAWDELTRLYEVRDDRALYERMRDLVDAGRLAAGWTRTSPGWWKTPEDANDGAAP